MFLKFKSSNGYFHRCAWLKQVEQLLLFVFLISFARIVRPRDEAENICHSRVNISSKLSILFTCNQQLEKEYARHPDLYRTDIAQYQADLRKIAEDPAIYCQLVAINQNINLSVELVGGVDAHHNMEETTAQNIAGYFRSGEEKLRLSNLVTKNKDAFSRQRTLFHEFHHIYMSARNRQLGINGLLQDASGKITEVSVEKRSTPDEIERSAQLLAKGGATFFWSTYPGRSVNSLQKLQNIFSTIQQRLENYIQLLNKNKMGEMLSRTSQETLSDLLAITHQYIPYQHRFAAPKKYVQELMHEGTIDSHGQLARKFMVNRLGVNFYYTSANIDPENFSGQLYGYTVMSLSAEDRREAALLDGYYKIKELKITQKKLPINLITETDAHLQDVYGKSPEIFKFIFRELYDFHQEMNRAVLNKCLSQQSLTSSNSDEALNKERRQVIVENTKKLKKNPSDAWALYYIADTYMALAKENYEAGQVKLSILAISKTFEHFKNFLKVSSISSVEKLYFQVVENYIVYLMKEKQYLNAKEVGEQALALIPKEYMLSDVATWGFHCQQGLAYLGLGQYKTAEKILKKAEKQLHRIFDSSQSQFNQAEVDSIKEYSSARVREIFQYLEQVQQALGKKEEAVKTRERSEDFVSRLESNPSDAEGHRIRFDL